MLKYRLTKMTKIFEEGVHLYRTRFYIGTEEEILCCNVPL